MITSASALKLTDMTRRDLRSLILELTQARGPQKSICPSEVARKATADDWRSLMESVREIARELAREGRIVFLQSGREVDPTDVRGVIRLRIAEHEVVVEPTADR